MVSVACVRRAWTWSCPASARQYMSHIRQQCLTCQCEAVVMSIACVRAEPGRGGVQPVRGSGG